MHPSSRGSTPRSSTNFQRLDQDVSFHGDRGRAARRQIVALQDESSNLSGYPKICGRRSTGLGYLATNQETWRFESSRPYQVFFDRIAQLDRACPSEGQDGVRIALRSPRFARWRPIGKALRCLRSLCEFDSRSPRQELCPHRLTGKDTGFSNRRLWDRGPLRTPNFWIASSNGRQHSALTREVPGSRPGRSTKVSFSDRLIGRALGC